MRSVFLVDVTGRISALWHGQPRLCDAERLCHWTQEESCHYEEGKGAFIHQYLFNGHLSLSVFGAKGVQERSRGNQTEVYRHVF